MEGPGPTVMLVLSVDSWDTHPMVCIFNQKHGWHYHSLNGIITNAGASAYSGHSSNRVAWPYIFSAVNCNGSESQLLDCIYSTHIAECGQAEAAYVHCQPGRCVQYYSITLPYSSPSV